MVTRLSCSFFALALGGCSVLGFFDAPPYECVADCLDADGDGDSDAHADPDAGGDGDSDADTDADAGTVCDPNEPSVNTRTDDSNCGYCGQSCGTILGECVGGKCISCGFAENGVTAYSGVMATFTCYNMPPNALVAGTVEGSIDVHCDHAPQHSTGHSIVSVNPCTGVDCSRESDREPVTWQTTLRSDASGTASIEVEAHLCGQDDRCQMVGVRGNPYPRIRLDVIP